MHQKPLPAKTQADMWYVVIEDLFMQGERGRCWAQRRQLLGVQIVHAHSEKKTLCVQLTHANDALQCKTQKKNVKIENHVKIAWRIICVYKILGIAFVDCQKIT